MEHFFLNRQSLIIRNDKIFCKDGPSNFMVFVYPIITVIAGFVVININEDILQQYIVVGIAMYTNIQTWVWNESEIDRISKKLIKTKYFFRTKLFTRSVSYDSELFWLKAYNGVGYQVFIGSQDSKHEVLYLGQHSHVLDLEEILEKNSIPVVRDNF